MKIEDIKKMIVQRGGFIAFFVVPFTIISLFREHEWVGRIVALSIALYIGTLLALWYSLNPKSEMVKKGGSLNKAGREKSKKIVSLLARIFFFGLGLFLLHLTTMFTLDISSILKGEAPLTIRGKVIDNTTAFGSWFLYQNISLDTGVGSEKKQCSLSLFYSAKPRLKREKSYELMVLPRSEIILEVRKID